VRDLADAAGDLRTKAIAIFNLGVANYDIGNLTEAIRSAELAGSLFLKIDSPYLQTVRSRLFQCD